MGKIVTVYLTDDETKNLTRFCEENACSQYTAIKTGLELLNRPRGKGDYSRGAGKDQGRLTV